MNKVEVIGYIAKNKLIEECIKGVTGGVWRAEYEDLVQDLLLELYQVTEAKLVGLYERDQLKFYLTRVVKNNIQSKTSRFYYRYRRFSFCNAGTECKMYRDAIEPEDE